jgi:hypothetical protein
MDKDLIVQVEIGGLAGEVMDQGHGEEYVMGMEHLDMVY